MSKSLPQSHMTMGGSSTFPFAAISVSPAGQRIRSREHGACSPLTTPIVLKSVIALYDAKIDSLTLQLARYD